MSRSAWEFEAMFQGFEIYRIVGAVREPPFPGIRQQSRLGVQGTMYHPNEGRAISRRLV